jgi:2'-5' RNA ligase
MPFTHFIMVPIRATQIHEKLNNFTLSNNLVKPLDPHITLLLLELQTQSDINQVCAIMDSINIPKLSIRSSGLVAISPVGKTLGKFRLTDQRYDERPPGGMLLANVQFQHERHLDPIWERRKWPGKILMQRKYHISFSEARGSMRNNREFWNAMRKADDEQVDFGEVVVDEIHLCEMSSVDGIYRIVHRLRLL